MFDAPAAGKVSRPRLSRSLIERGLSGRLTVGSLTIRYPDGTETRLEGGVGPAAKVEFKSWAALRRVVLNPPLAFGEAYMDGDVVILEGDIYGVLDTLMTSDGYGEMQPFMSFRQKLGRLRKRWTQFNPVSIARRNIAKHYDLGGELYSLLLDDDRQYSCAYFRSGDETLDEAQLAKKRHIASKLVLDRPGLRVLDIGCGWGGMALTLAREYGARVTGITLSREQLEAARARAQAAGLADQCRFELLDYRAVPVTFDRIVSVGMFEHVGINHYRRFFEVVRRCLEPDGVALIHAIGRGHGPEATNSWLNKHIFPGGYSPSLSEVMPAVEKSGLVTTDVEILRLHYAVTLSHWRKNLNRNRDAVIALYDERFWRMFEFYLSGAELAFRRNGHMVWQLQVARNQEAVPLTRDYIKE